MTINELSIGTNLNGTRLICPVCGQDCGIEGSLEELSIRVSFDIKDLDGKYCLYCFAKWIKDNIPLLKRVEEEGNKEKTNNAY